MREAANLFLLGIITPKMKLPKIACTPIYLVVTWLGITNNLGEPGADKDGDEYEYY
jgi:hypothetical protein